MSTHETGHATNVANFEQLISYCKAYGTTYNPTKNALKTSSMDALLSDAQVALNIEKDKHNAYSVAVDNREIIFTPLNKMITRILNALETSEVPEQKITDAKSIIRKITGKRAVAKPKNTVLVQTNNTTPQEQSAPTTEPKIISASQTGFNNRLDNFSKLVNLLESEKGYIPNEKELQVVTLNKMTADMKTNNTVVINASTALSNARIQRNKILYIEISCLYNTALEAKTYIKSIFGAASPEYKQVSRIKFTKTR
jgi:hypothetical protein